ncbi:uncharacterized protein ZK1073.1 isoform X2 [Lingula anatina]|uniref:Uncharacterized protein ZK1073.1 n=1 Tax=Lingula anatina TaxID=7574 RepID=A0A1S3K0I2_LINAN|nr:uncharacterized protein ZK1073.1 [Lingula anatina]XP_013415874.1 uncharacterized protein ZK1073.1 isoform X2 [Lingula anatina]|eukprot:XP_013410580.1 uncharacterized protein ZK1073.1 [Lingula anatina]
MAETTGQDLKQEVVDTDLGRFNVYLQGDLGHAEAIILTVHDLGCNHTMYNDFVNHPSMKELTSRVVWIHVDLPGQEENAPDLPADYRFPTMAEMGGCLGVVLDKLGVTRPVMCFGEGAGANILARFAICHPMKVHGLCLIHCTGTTAGIMETMKDKVMQWKLDHFGMTPSTAAYLVMHRFGSFEAVDKQMEQIVEDFRNKLKKEVNPKNLTKFVDSFMKRSELLPDLKNITCFVLLVTGEKASFNHTCKTLEVNFRKSIENKKKLESLEVEGVANVIVERPEKLAEAFLYFMQGAGLVSSIGMPKIGKGVRTRSVSMEEADMPKIRTGSLSTSPPKTDGQTGQ